MFKLSFSRWVLAAGFALLSVLDCSVSSAQESSERGREFFEIGVQAYSRGRYDAAIAAFSQSYRLSKRPGLLFSIAQAYRKAYDKNKHSKNLRRAIEHYERYLRVDELGKRQEEAEKHLAQLKKPAHQLGSEDRSSDNTDIKTQLVIAATVEGASLRIDGKKIHRLPHAQPVPSGSHSLEVSAPGYITETRKVNIKKGDVIAVNFKLKKVSARLNITGTDGAEVMIDKRAVGVIPTGPLPLPVGEHQIEVRKAGHYTEQRTLLLGDRGEQRVHINSRVTSQRVVGWSLVGIGAAGALTSGVLGILAVGKENEAIDLDGTPGALAARDARDSLRNAAVVSGAAGVGFGLAGVFTILVEGYGPVRRTAPGASARIEFTPFADGGHVTLAGTL